MRLLTNWFIWKAFQPLPSTLEEAFYIHQEKTNEMFIGHDIEFHHFLLRLPDHVLVLLVIPYVAYARSLH